MAQTRRQAFIRRAAAALALTLCFSLPGCVNLVSKPFKLYDGPALSKDKIAVVICVLNAQINVDDKEDVNPNSRVWGSRLELLPGPHRIGIRPHGSFLGPGYTNLPDLLDEDVLYFDAVAGKTYKVLIEKNHVDMTLMSASERENRYIVNDIEIKFSIIETGSNKVVSRREA